MKYFLDSAKMDEIKRAYQTFGIDGVTTNPRHIQNSGKSFYEVLQQLSEWVKEEHLEGYERFPISVEVNPHLDTPEEMVAEGEKIAQISDNFVIKIPCTQAGVTAARNLEKKGVRTNLTLVFSPSQALIGAKNHSLFVSPFIGWKEDNGEDCKEYIQNIVKIFKNYGYDGKTQIICAAIRTSKQIVECATAGADIVTAGLDVYLESFIHPYTSKGIDIFTQAWDQTKGN